MFEGWKVSTRWWRGGEAPGLGKMPIESQGCSCPMNICNSILSILVSISWVNCQHHDSWPSSPANLNVSSFVFGFEAVWIDVKAFPLRLARLCSISLGQTDICAMHSVHIKWFYPWLFLCFMLYNQALCALEGGGRGWYVLETSMSCKRM